MPQTSSPDVRAQQHRAGGGRPLRRDAQRNRQRILEAAQEVFAEDGLRASLDDVARRAGVGVATVYRRFPDKEALVEAIFDARIDVIIDVVEQAQALPDGWEGLVHFLHEVSRVQAGDRGLREIALSTGYGRSRVAAQRSRVEAGIAQLIARAKAEGTLRQEINANDVPCCSTWSARWRRTPAGCAMTSPAATSASSSTACAPTPARTAAATSAHHPRTTSSSSSCRDGDPRHARHAHPATNRTPDERRAGAGSS